MKKTLLLALVVLAFSCQNDKIEVDSIIINATVYTVNDAFEVAEAFAVKDGKFIAVGNNEAIQSKYNSAVLIDAKGQTVVPGFIDAHCHFLGLGLNAQSVDLVDSKSFEEVVQRVVDFQNDKNLDY